MRRLICWLFGHRWHFVQAVRRMTRPLPIASMVSSYSAEDLALFAKPPPWVQHEVVRCSFCGLFADKNGGWTELVTEADCASEAFR